MDRIELARTALQDAKNVVFLTGAGLSAASGVPTFRGDGGYWRNKRFEELACMNAFLEDPIEQWAWYTERRRTCINAQPNAGHHAIKRFQDARPRTRVVTQNVDGLHERVFTHVTRFHGTLWENRCSRCLAVRPCHDLGDYTTCPTCPACGGRERVNVVWFNEGIPAAAYLEAEEAFERADTVVVVGTSGNVFPAAGYAHAAIQRGLPVIDVNPTPTFDGALDLAGSANDILPLLLEV